MEWQGAFLSPPSISLFKCWRTLFSSILNRKHGLEIKGDNSQTSSMEGMKTLPSYLLQMDSHSLFHLSFWAHTMEFCWTAPSPPERKHTTASLHWPWHGKFSLSCWMRTQLGKEGECQVTNTLHTSSLLWETVSSVLSVFEEDALRQEQDWVWASKERVIPYPVMTSLDIEEYNCTLLI